MERAKQRRYPEKGGGLAGVEKTDVSRGRPLVAIERPPRRSGCGRDERTHVPRGGHAGGRSERQCFVSRPRNWRFRDVLEPEIRVRSVSCMSATEKDEDHTALGWHHVEKSKETGGAGVRRSSVGKGERSALRGEEARRGGRAVTGCRERQ